MRNTSLKLSVLTLALAAFAFVPAASATTYDLTNNNLSGLNGTSIGTVSIVDNGSGGVTVTISMNAGYGVFMNNQNGQGGQVFITVSGVTLTQASLTGLSSGSVTGFGAPPPPVIGGFSYSYSWSLAGGTSPSTFSFTINGVSASQISSLGIHFICLTGNCPGSNSNTGFVETGTPLAPVPEPGTLGLLGTGLVGIAGMVRRRYFS